MSRRVALDVESVLADTNEAALQSTDKLDREELFGSWDMTDYQWQVYMGVTDSVWRHNPASIPPEEPLIEEYVKEIYSRHDLDIVTGRTGVDEQMVWWLDEHGIEYNDFISTDQAKYLLDYDVYIDDNPEMFDECRLLLRHHRWNKHLNTEESKMTDRIYSLAEVLDFL
jgi:hypothetical protein